MDNQAQGMLLNAMLAWREGEFWGEWIHVHVWLSPFVVYLKLSQH